MYNFLKVVGFPYIFKIVGKNASIAARKEVRVDLDDTHHRPYIADIYRQHKGKWIKNTSLIPSGKAWFHSCSCKSLAVYIKSYTM